MSLFDHGNLTSKVEPVAAASLVYSNKTAIETAQASKYSCIARPIGPVNSNVLDFEMPAQGDGVYTNMKDMTLYVEGKVVKGDDTDLEATDNVALVNNAGSSLFNQTESRVNDRALPGQSFTDTDLKAYVDVLATKDVSSKNKLELQGWYPDTESHHNSTNGNHNAGFTSRKELIAGSRTFAFCSPIQADLLKSANHLGPGNKLSIRLVRNPDEKVLMHNIGGSFKVKLTTVYIEYTRIVTNLPPPTFETHYFPHTELLRFPLGTGTTSFNINVQNGGKIPRSMFLFFVRTDAINGACHRNMFEFQNLGIKSLLLRSNGSPHPSEPLTPNFTQNRVTRELNHLFQNLGCDWSQRTGFINRSRFLNGYTLFAHDLTPDKCNGKHIHELFNGSLMYEGKCDALPFPVTACVYKAWDIEMTIDRSAGVPGGHTLSYMNASGGNSA